MEKPDKNNAAILLRLPEDMKEELQKQANINGRRITAEINTRLKISLAAKGPTLQGILAREAFGDNTPTPPLTAEDPRASYGNQLSDIDKAILAVVRAMPPEKQLALLSLFK